MPVLSRLDLHDYQNKSVDFIINQTRAGLFLGLGLGKTIISLTTIADLINACLAKRVLIIAPLRVANSVWAQEAKQWEHTKHLNFSICTGNERQRLAGLMKDSDVFVINRENVQWLVKHYKDKWPFDCVVVDESSSFKSASSGRFKALKKVMHHTRYLWLLTGTPSPNGLIDLWSQMYLIDYGESLGRTITNYRSRFFDTDYFGRKYNLRDGSEAKIHALIDDKIMSLAAEDYLDMPDRIDIIVRVDLPTAVLKKYREFERNLIVELVTGEDIEAETAAVLANKLLQWSNGAMYTDKLGNWAETHREKLDALEDIIDDNPGENILVAYNYKSDLERIKIKFPKARVLDKNPQTIQDWNAGKIPLLLAHPQSAGHGLNLQHGGATIVWFGLNWSLELDQQFNGRLHRQGQERPVRVIRIVAAGCLDERVLQVLAIKDAVQSNLLAALKPTGVL